MNKKYDLIIIGMGPGGVFCAYELIQKNKHQNILLIEQGHSIEKRYCPIATTGKCMKCKPFCNITCGFSGAGAFSDGKVNSYHLATGVKDNLYLGGNDAPTFRATLTTEQIKDLFAYTDDIYLKFGANKELTGIKYQEEIQQMQLKARKENLDLVQFPIRHLGTEKAHLLYSKLEKYLRDNGVEMVFDTIVSDLIIENNVVKGVKTISSYTKDHEQTYYSKNVCLAVGRKGAD